MTYCDETRRTWFYWSLLTKEINDGQINSFVSVFTFAQQQRDLKLLALLTNNKYKRR